MDDGVKDGVIGNPSMYCGSGKASLQSGRSQQCLTATQWRQQNVSTTDRLIMRKGSARRTGGIELNWDFGTETGMQTACSRHDLRGEPGMDHSQL